MKEAFEKIRKRLEPEADFFSGEPMGSLQKAYYCKGVEKAMEIVSEVEAEYDNPKTNADRIRAMSDEEFARFLCEQGFCVDERCPRLWDETDCVECITEWLKSEVK